eukprot:1193602-Prorocentrum_minimum.AAC.2
MLFINAVYNPIIGVGLGHRASLVYTYGLFCLVSPNFKFDPQRTRSKMDNQLMPISERALLASPWFAV